MITLINPGSHKQVGSKGKHNDHQLYLENNDCLNESPFFLAENYRLVQPGFPINYKTKKK